jgi:hypothetical protein
MLAGYIGEHRSSGWSGFLIYWNFIFQRERFSAAVIPAPWFGVGMDALG